MHQARTLALCCAQRNMDPLARLLVRYFTVYMHAAHVMIALLVVLALQLCVGSALVPSASCIIYYIFYINAV